MITAFQKMMLASGNKSAGVFELIHSELIINVTTDELNHDFSAFSVGDLAIITASNSFSSGYKANIPNWTSVQSSGTSNYPNTAIHWKILSADDITNGLTVSARGFNNFTIQGLFVYTNAEVATSAEALNNTTQFNSPTPPSVSVTSDDILLVVASKINTATPTAPTGHTLLESISTTISVHTQAVSTKVITSTGTETPSSFGAWTGSYDHYEVSIVIRSTL